MQSIPTLHKKVIGNQNPRGLALRVFPRPRRAPFVSQKCPDFAQKSLREFRTTTRVAMGANGSIGSAFGVIDSNQLPLLPEAEAWEKSICTTPRRSQRIFSQKFPVVDGWGGSRGQFVDKSGIGCWLPKIFDIQPQHLARLR